MSSNGYNKDQDRGQRNVIDFSVNTDTKTTTKYIFSLLQTYINECHNLFSYFVLPKLWLLSFNFSSVIFLSDNFVSLGQMLQYHELKRVMHFKLNFNNYVTYKNIACTLVCENKTLCVVFI